MISAIVLLEACSDAVQEVLAAVLCSDAAQEVPDAAQKVWSSSVVLEACSDAAQEVADVAVLLKVLSAGLYIDDHA